MTNTDHQPLDDAQRRATRQGAARRPGRPTQLTPEGTTLATLNEVIERGWERRAELGPGRADARAAGRRGGVHRRARRRHVARRRAEGRALGGESVAQAGRAVVVPAERQPRDRRGLHALLRQGAAQVRASTTRSSSASGGTRVVPDAVVRRGAYVAPDVVLMPSLRQHRRIRRSRLDDRHVGHGRQLRPDRQARAPVRRRRASAACSSRCRRRPRSSRTTASSARARRSSKASIVERGSVIAMGVYISQSTRIYDRDTGEIAVRPSAGRLRRRLRQPAVARRQVLPVLRRHRQESRREDARQNLAERAPPHRRLIVLAARGSVGAKRLRQRVGALSGTPQVHPCRLARRRPWRRASRKHPYALPQPPNRIACAWPSPNEGATRKRSQRVRTRHRSAGTLADRTSAREPTGTYLRRSRTTYVASEPAAIGHRPERWRLFTCARWR